MYIVAASGSADGVDVTLDLDVSFLQPVNVSLLKQSLLETLTNVSFAVDLSSLTVTRMSTLLFMIFFIERLTPQKENACTFFV